MRCRDDFFAGGAVVAKHAGPTQDVENVDRLLRQVLGDVPDPRQQPLESLPVHLE